MIEILDITEHPLQVIGKNAGICWNAKDSVDSNVARAKDCISSRHDRVLEYPDVTMVISDYSARCIRELYTHIVGTTRLQESTRYVDCKNSLWFTPSGYNEAQTMAYNAVMREAFSNYARLLEIGFSKEDAANALPLGMHTKIVWKVNLRALVHFMNMRLCNRAYSEIRALSREIRDTLKAVNGEWGWLAVNLFVPKCVADGGCTEKNPCKKKAV